MTCSQTRSSLLAARVFRRGDQDPSLQQNLGREEEDLRRTADRTERRVSRGALLSLSEAQTQTP